jgi:hypothetical protein
LRTQPQGREQQARSRRSAAIVAGRARRASGNYKRLSDMVGNAEVRKLFDDWK